MGSCGIRHYVSTGSRTHTGRFHYREYELALDLLDSEPFLILSLLCGLRYMRNVSVITKPKIDVLSVVLSTIGFGGIVLVSVRQGRFLTGRVLPL
mgnify:CR=1 FL=1